MPDLPTIVFVRHGETDWNVEGRLQGQRDIPLNDNGRAQARRNGKAIIAAMPDVAGYDFVASPLVRSRETMEIARLAMGLDPSAYHLDERLREITFGEWEGFTTEELRQHEPALVAAREKDKWGFLPPGGESYRVLSKRIEAWLADVGRPTFAVSHGGVGRVLRRHVLGLDPHEAVAMSFPQDRALLIKDGVASWI
jgi:broad specificity phosphatase PhoE